MEGRQGFIQIPILVAIVLGVILVSGMGYVGVRQYKNYQAQQSEKEKMTQGREKEARALAETQQKALEETKSEIEKLKKQNAESMNKQSALEQEIKNEQKKSAESAKSNSILNLPRIIKEWRQRVAFIACLVSNRDTGQKIGTVSGSGFLFYIGGVPNVLTNRHVLVDIRDPRTTQNFYKTDSCQVTFPDDRRAYDVSLSDTVVGFENGRDVDWGMIAFKNPDTYITSLLNSNLSVCKSAPALGDPIVILGYPAIGSPTDITATDGIISGFDGDFYVTNAKVERGNSGGVAILINNDCYLGLPTFVTAGSLESLARIMKWQAVITATGP